jgi:16S rRNA (uracil1498-N3)-methyltransferase
MASVYLHIDAEHLQGDTVIISGAEFHHLIHVLRLGLGASLRVALNDGRVFAGAISTISPTAFSATLLHPIEQNVTPLCRIVLFQAMLKGEKMDWVVQKATELGVATLVPLLTLRSVPRLLEEQAASRVTRWQRIADSAAAQCERALPMRVEPLCAVRDVAERLPGFTLLLHEREGQSLADLHTAIPRAAEIGILIGPEGGWSPEENVALLAARAQPVRLGSRILRAETAATVAIALAQYLWGDLGDTLLEGQ